MQISELKQSKFLKKEDCGEDGIVVTIRGDVFMENMALEGDPEQLKACIEFEEVEKPLTLNQTNLQAIARIVGSEETTEWVGHQVVLYNDPNVAMKGKVVGGIRIRGLAPAKPSLPSRPAPRTAAARPAPQAPAPRAAAPRRAPAAPAPAPAQDGDDVPFDNVP